MKKVDEGVAWGSVHWQYLEDMSKVTPYEGTPLKLKKTLYVKTNTARGPVLEPVQGPLAVGDELVVRIELRVDRDMEYVHLKDQRGSGTEPVNVLSRYKYQDGLAYYESTRDTASHFFIDYLPKGTYVFEYSTPRAASRPVPDRRGADPVHVRAGVQQPQRELAAGGEVGPACRYANGWQRQSSWFKPFSAILLVALETSPKGRRLNGRDGAQGLGRSTDTQRKV